MDRVVDENWPETYKTTVGFSRLEMIVEKKNKQSSSHYNVLYRTYIVVGRR